MPSGTGPSPLVTTGCYTSSLHATHATSSTLIDAANTSNGDQIHLQSSLCASSTFATPKKILQISLSPACSWHTLDSSLSSRVSERAMNVLALSLGSQICEFADPDQTYQKDELALASISSCVSKRVIQTQANIQYALTHVRASF